MKIIKVIFKSVFKLILAIILMSIIALFIGFATVYYQTSRDNIMYQDNIENVANEYNIDPLFIASIVKVESGYKNTALSDKNAQGLMQLLPDTAKHIAELYHIDYKDDQLSDPDYNLKLGTAYIRYLYNYYGNRDLAVAAYNGGIGNIDKMIDEGLIKKENPDINKINIEETRQYVRKVNSNYKVLKVFYKDKLPTKEQLQSRFKLSLKNYKNLLLHLIDII